MTIMVNKINTIIPLVDEEDVVQRGSRKGKEKDSEYIEREKKEKVEKKKKKEKPIRILRIKYHEKSLLKFMEEGKIKHKEIFAVNRGLEGLLKELYYNTNMQGSLTPSDCTWVEKDDRMGFNNKFIFIDIGKNEFNVLKRQLENHTVICAFNMGEFSILEGGRSYLSDTWDMPKIWKADNKKDGISDSNEILAIERLRDELKDKLRAYHSKSDEDIDNMSHRELVAIKKLANEKMKIENRKIRALKGLLR